MYNFHILTPCSRPDNLIKLKENIVQTKTNAIAWHVCFDTLHTTDAQRAAAKETLTEEWIYTYSASTDGVANPGKSQINFILTHFANNLFRGFIYVLDDDNLLPPDFFSHNYNTKESLIYLLPQYRYSKHTPSIPVAVLNQVDQGQLIVHSNILHFYQLVYNADGVFVQEICEKNKYKILDKPIVYYNRLTQDFWSKP